MPISWLLPPHFSPTAQILFWGTMLLYWRGLRAGARPGFGRALSFVLGAVLMYAVAQTRFDYYSQYMFFMHRLQHLGLHHLGPFLLALAQPQAVLAAGLPPTWRAQPLPAPLKRAGRWLYLALQNPLVAPLLFVGLIAFWLTPSLHFDAMLNLNLYWLMNWSMALDGLLFWFWAFERGRNGVAPRFGYGVRLLVLVLIAPPQIVIGSRIALSDQELFDVYAVCGRAWPLSPIVDQQIGGLVTWIPAAMMSVLGMLVVLAGLLRHSRNAATRPRYTEIVQ